MMERTESCFFVKQSLPKGLMGAFLLFCVTFLMFLQALTQWGEASGCRLLFLRSGPVKEKNGVMAQTVELSLEGSYFEILVFFELFEQKGQGMHAEETLLKRSEKGNKLIFQTKIVHFATEIVTI